MARGGKRAGAGRPKGSKGHRRLAAAVLSSAAELRALPLDRLLSRIADETLDAKYRDTLCLGVVPYLVAKPLPGLAAKCSFEMTDGELQATIAREEAFARGESAGSIIRLPTRRRL